MKNPLETTYLETFESSLEYYLEEGFSYSTAEECAKIDATLEFLSIAQTKLKALL